MALGQKAIRNRLCEYVSKIEELVEDASVKEACSNYLSTLGNSGVSTHGLNDLWDAAKAEE